MPPRTQSAGLRVGRPATKAQALVQGSVIQDADPVADAEALERLAFWMLQRVAPIVAADRPDGVVIDSTGADDLHGGEAATLAILVEKLAGVGRRARAAIIGQNNPPFREPVLDVAQAEGEEPEV